MTDRDYQRLGQAVSQRRAQLRLTREAAARAVPMSPITWKRVEDGQPVRDVTYGGIEKALSWPAGYTVALLDGRDVADPPFPEPHLTTFEAQSGNVRVLIAALDDADEATRQDMVDAALAAYRAYKRGRA